MRRSAYVKQGVNDLATVRPDLVEEWSSDNPVKPNEIAAGSHMWATWKCKKCGHIWQARVNMRTKGNNDSGTNCPRCAGFTTNSHDRNTKHSQTNNIASAFDIKSLSTEFNEDKNPNTRLVDLNKNQGWKVWWTCSVCGHDWQASLFDRRTGAECPSCAYKSSHPALSSFSSIIDKWDSNRNDVPIDNVDRNKKYWWKCPTCGYSWRAFPRDVDRADCTVCQFKPSDEQVRLEQMITSVFHGEEIVLHDRSLLDGIEWNGDTRTLGVDVLLPSLSIAFDWCDGHSLDDELYSKQATTTYRLLKRRACAMKGVRLLYVYTESFDNIAELKQALEDLSDGIVSYKFLSLGRGRKTGDRFDDVFPNLAKNFIRTVKADDLVPCEATSSSHRSCVWKCELCGIEFERSYESINCDGYCRCKACRIASHKLEDKRRFKPGESLGDLSPWAIREWSIKNVGLTPFDVASRSHLEVWWRCEHGHEWRETISNRTCTDHSRRSGCPYCANVRVWTGWNDMATTDPEIALDWSVENDTPATEIGVWSNKAAKWKCHLDGTEWTTSPNKMKRVLSYRCPGCRRRLVPGGTSKMENDVCKTILQRHPELAANTMRNVRCLWTPDCEGRKNGKHKEIDMIFASIRLGVEFDGKHWHSDEAVSADWNGYYKTAEEYREAKRKAALDVGLRLVFILESDWQEDPVECLDRLDEIIYHRKNEVNSAWTRSEITHPDREARKKRG